MIDANSLLNLTRELGENVVKVLIDSSTASLAYYEIGNTLWKECNLLKEFNLKKATKILEFTASMMRSMKVVHPEENDLGSEVLHTANKRNITYYDATYLTIAKQSEKVLVTDDEKLREAAEKAGVPAVGSDELTKS